MSQLLMGILLAAAVFLTAMAGLLPRIGMVLLIVAAVLSGIVLLADLIAATG